VFKKKLLALVGGVFALTLIGSEPAAARVPQEARDLQTDANRPTANSRRQRTPRQQPAAVAVATPEQIMAEAQSLLTASGSTCQVTEAVQPGATAEQQKIYEAACSQGPGYILVASTPPQVVDCIELAGTAATARLRDPAADVGQQCVLPANQNGLAVIGGWAREAGVRCTIDEAVAIGRSTAQNIIYEVGCAGADGYWLERTGTGWDLKDCLEVTSTNGTCRFTTAQETADTFETKLAGTDAAACDVTRVRLMGQNPNGRFFEAKCAAEGEGYIARLNPEGVTQQIYPCATAQTIGGGCTLTPAPAAAPATTE
jgi:hypothetical protein